VQLLPADDPEKFDEQFLALVAQDRRLGGVVYDAVKQIPAFVRLVASQRHEALFRQLRDTDLAGVAAGGYGIRIDIPGEERYRADWHQEYPAQLRSMDGLVFWSPLVPISEAMGPVKICPGSQREGLLPVMTNDPDQPGKGGAYGLVLKGRDDLIMGYQQVAPLTRPGDLIVMDFLTLHASGVNVSDRCRWSMQSRLFNFRDPTGISYGWCGSYAAGIDFQKIHPELVSD
jgi:hypothetical protein